jgi:hypothetical protein
MGRLPTLQHFPLNGLCELIGMEFYRIRISAPKFATEPPGVLVPATHRADRGSAPAFIRAAVKTERTHAGLRRKGNEPGPCEGRATWTEIEDLPEELGSNLENSRITAERARRIVK